MLLKKTGNYVVCVTLIIKKFLKHKYIYNAYKYIIMDTIGYNKAKRLKKISYSTMSKISKANNKLMNLKTKKEYT